MRNTYLIADSGGTQTDWCFVNENNERTYFTTPSFHPSHWNEKFQDDYQLFWEKHPAYKTSKVIFYGAGCLNEQNNQKMKEYFFSWGFDAVSILSDLEGACHAALGNKSGVVSILGTGSVVCEYNGDTLEKINGGFGYLLGDEGSGYYLGKLVLQKLLNRGFSIELQNELSHLFGDRSAVLAAVYGEFGKQFVGTIPSKLADLNEHIEIVELHYQNLDNFFNLYISSIIRSDKKLSIIGRYGMKQSNNLNKIAVKYGWEIEKFIDSPIKLITDYVLNDTV